MNHKYQKNHSQFVNKGVCVIFFSMILSIAFSVSISDFVYADVIAPEKQMNLNFSAEEVVCKEHLIKAILLKDGHPICVKPDTIDTLDKRGIIQSPTMDIQTDTQQKIEPVGKIIHLATTKPPVNPSEVITAKKVSEFNYVFQVCSNGDVIKSPEVIISSDKETKSIKLSRDVLAKSCNTTAVKVKASDPDSITSKLLNQGGVTEIITELETKIENLKDNLTQQREKLSSINVESPSTERAKKVSGLHKIISDIRMELKDTRAELQKYLLFLSLNSNNDLSPIQKEKSFTGIQVDDTLAEIISIHKALLQPETLGNDSTAFNVIFEVCTDKNILRMPVVEISSDLEKKTVRMAEKIVANSCQVTTTKIIANNADSISILLAGQTDTSDTIVELERKIISLKESMAIEQRKLGSAATSSTISDEERRTTLAQSTKIVEDLRKEINEVKIQLHKILLEVYRQN